jgi:hypothetical protein
VRNEQHQYWRQREVVKQKRKDRKYMLNAYVENVQRRGALI